MTSNAVMPACLCCGVLVHLIKNCHVNVSIRTHLYVDSLWQFSMAAERHLSTFYNDLCNDLYCTDMISIVQKNRGKEKPFAYARSFTFV